MYNKCRIKVRMYNKCPLTVSMYNKYPITIRMYDKYLLRSICRISALIQVHPKCTPFWFRRKKGLKTLYSLRSMFLPLAF